MTSRSLERERIAALPPELEPELGSRAGRVEVDLVALEYLRDRAATLSELISAGHVDDETVEQVEEAHAQAQLAPHAEPGEFRLGADARDRGRERPER
jgi:hypothetical protein